MGVPAVKIRVFGADGIYRGGLFKDYINRKLRWAGTPKPSLQEVMVSTEDERPGEGRWYLLELVLPRDISGNEECDSLLDEQSRCRCCTPPQALRWFSQQSFGPPSALVTRVRGFVKDWDDFVASPAARSLAQALQNRWVKDDDPALNGINRKMIPLLHRLEMLSVSESNSVMSYHLCSVAEDAGLEPFIEWLNGHVADIRHLVQQRPEEPGRLHARKPTGAKTTARVPAKERDLKAVATVHEWEATGRAWTLTDLANELGCDRNQLTGSRSNGTPRCPMFKKYWIAANAEKAERALSLRKTNRTRSSDHGDAGGA